MRMSEALDGIKYSGSKIVSSTIEYSFIHSEAARLGKADAAEKEEEKQLNESGYQAFETYLNRYEELVRANFNDEDVFLENIRASGHKLIKTSDEIIELNKLNIGGKEILEKKEEFKTDERVFLKYTDDALEHESKQSIEYQKNVQTNIALATQRTLIVRALTFILAILSGFYLSLFISRRIGRLKEAIRRVGSGELDTQIEINSKDEIGDISRSINKMIGDLKASRAELAAGKIFTDKVLDSMVDFVVVSDLDLTITQVNKSTLRLNGYEEHELVGKSVNVLMADRPFNKKGVDVLRKIGYAANFEKVIRNKDGTLTPVSMSLSVFKDEQGNDLGIVCVGKDISEHKRAEAEREVISEIIQGITSTTNLDELLQLIHRSIGRILYAENCFVALHDPATDLMHYEFWVDKFDPMPARRPIGPGFGSYVLRTEKPLLLTDELKNQMYASGAVERSGTKSGSWLGVPLQSPSRTIGVLVVQHYENENAYSQRDLEFLKSVGAKIALTIERKRVEEALRISEEHHRLLFETNPQPVFVYDLETLAFLAVNEAAIRQYGYSREEFLTAITVKDIHPIDYIPIFLERVSKVTSESDSVSAPSEHQNKSGTVFDVEITSHALVFAGKRAEIVLVNDVTERRRLEAESTVISEIIQGVTSTANLDELLNLIHRSIGKILYAENCYVALYDAKTDLLSVVFCVDKYDEPAAPAKLGTGLTAYVLRKNQPMLMTTDVIHKLTENGDIAVIGTDPAIWLGVPLRTPEGIIGVLVVQHYENPDAYNQRDVGFLSSVGDQIALAIERKRAENALRENEEKYRELFENANDIIYTLDLSGGFTSLNRAGEGITGYGRAEAMQMNIADVIAPKDKASVRDRIAQNIKGSELPNFELEIIAKDKRKVTMDISSRLILQGGVPVGIQGIGRDITERLRVQQELERFNEKLQKSNRELQDFAYVASHDLQEPLRKVQAFSDRLKTKYADKLEGDGLDYLERMRSAANRMQLLIQDLLTFSRVSTKARAFIPVNLEMVTREVLSDLEVKIEESGATVEFKDLPTIDADPMQMRQMIQNLVGNALKFRQKDKAPIISIRARQVESNGNGAAGRIQISVQDNGIGFDEKYTDKIFAVFQRLHGRTEYEGSGVGLAICRKIVERHNGDITAQSLPGDGSTFIVTLPLKQSKVEVT